MCAGAGGWEEVLRDAGADTCRSGAVVPGELKRGTCRKKRREKKWIESGDRGGYMRVAVQRSSECRVLSVCLLCNMQEIKGFSFLKQSKQVERKRLKYKDRKDGGGGGGKG